MKRSILILAVLLIVGIAFAQTPAQPYKPGDYQKDNPNYFVRNPFYFEGRINWNLLEIDVPKDAWEYAQRGLHYQDDLEDFTSAIADYRQSIAMNSLSNGTCQLITAAPTGFGQTTNPPPCMFTVRLRLGYLLHETNPADAITLFREVLNIDPLRLGVNALIGETYAKMAEHAASEDAKR